MVDGSSQYQFVIAKNQPWFSIGATNGINLRCADCGNEIDLEIPAADHHPAVCPYCGVECVFLPWRNKTLQVVPNNAPASFVKAIRWAQRQLDELELVELICAMEEIADAI